MLKKPYLILNLLFRSSLWSSFKSIFWRFHRPERFEKVAFHFLLGCFLFFILNILHDCLFFVCLFNLLVCLKRRLIKKHDQQQSYQWTGNINCSLEGGRKTQEESKAKNLWIITPYYIWIIVNHNGLVDYNIISYTSICFANHTLCWKGGERLREMWRKSIFKLYIIIISYHCELL